MNQSTQTIKSICEHLPEKLAASAGVMTLASAFGFTSNKTK